MQQCAVGKWFRSTPELEAKKLKQQQKKLKEKNSKTTKRKPKSNSAPVVTKRKKPHSDSDPESDTNEHNSESDRTSEEDDNPKLSKKARILPDITAYINIETPPRTTKLKATIEPRGPFFFNIETTYDSFIETLAKTVQSNATKASINQSKLKWKQDVPANDKPKPLSNAAGYRAMITKLTELLAKNKDTTITLTLPPLLRVAQEVLSVSYVFFIIGLTYLQQPGEASGTGFDGEVEEFAQGPSGSSIREQKVWGFIQNWPLLPEPPQESLNRTNAPLIEQLRLKYPIGADPRFPTKRIYSADDGRSWELNDIRLQVWAVHLVRIHSSLSQ